MKRDVFLESLPWEEALEGYLDFLERSGWLRPGPPERVPVEAAAGRVTAEPVWARLSSPHYHAAAMDGLAVEAARTYGASETSPRQLRLGEEAFPVNTGQPLPPACDAVIMIEDVYPAGPDRVEVLQGAHPWQHVRVMGEDLVATEMILPANHRLRPWDLGGLLAGGVVEAAVHPRPRVALLATGSEVVEPGSPLQPGQVVESNTRMEQAALEEWGAEAWRLGIVPDRVEALEAAVLEAVKGADLVLINAGSSAGTEDYTAGVIGSLGKVLVHGVATRPGKPVILGSVEGKPVLGVPGYPVSAWLCLELFVRPLVYRKLGLTLPERDKTEARVGRKMVSPLGVEEFVRVKLGQVGGRLLASPLPRGAGITTSLIRADGIIRVPRQSEGFRAEETVAVELLRPLENIRETTVVTGSHDLALDVLASRLGLRFPGTGLSSSHVGSLGGLTALERDEAHAAGLHLLDEETGEYNLPYVRRLLPGRQVVLVNLTYRQQGLLVAPGNPKGIKGLEDLVRTGIRLVNRQRGAGTRILLDYRLKELGIDPGTIEGYQREEYTHMAVAAAVASGSADAGMGILAAARALGLDFIPLEEERYDLCIPREYWETPPVRRLLEVMADPVFQSEVASLGGYDLRDCGRIVGEN